MSAFDGIMNGIGAAETLIVWGPFRNVSHAYRQHVYAKDLSSIMWVTVCGRALRPRAGVVGPQPKRLTEACCACREALGLVAAPGPVRGRGAQRMKKIITR